jgi:hypothetical protein
VSAPIEKEMPEMFAVRLGPGVSHAMSSSLAREKIRRPIRIVLGFKGCCDASFSRIANGVKESDLLFESEDPTFVIDPETTSWQVK